MATSETHGCTVSLWGVWFAAFLIIKLAGTSLAAWSWWWVLLPIVPVLFLVIQRLGLL